MRSPAKYSYRRSEIFEVSTKNAFQRVLSSFIHSFNRSELGREVGRPKLIKEMFLESIYPTNILFK